MKKHVSLLSVSIALFAIGCGSDGDDGELIGGKGEPEIAFTFVPELGSQEVLRGKVFHVLPSEYKVTVLIQVCGGWWTKPYAHRR